MNDALDDMTGTGYQPPRDPVEIWLARQWQDILGFAVGIRESFFDLGLTSLALTDLKARIETVIGRPVSATALFNRPTVQHLLDHLTDDVLADLFEKEPTR